MRIGLSGTFWGMRATGTGQYLEALLRAMVAQAPEEYHLFLPRYIQMQSTKPSSWHTHFVCTPFDGRHENLAKLWYEQLAYPWACRKEGIDVAHVPYFSPPLAPTVPTVVTIHDLIPLSLPEYRGSWLVRSYMQRMARAARRAARILTDSQASANDIQRLLRIPADRIQVVYLAAAPHYRELSREERQPILTRWGLPARYLLYLGGFDRRKNVPELIQAYSSVSHQLGDVALVIAGELPTSDTAFTPDPRRVADELKVNVHCIGWVPEEDKPALYSGATALAFPSRYEGFGLPVLEALRCGTPVVTTTGSSLEEVAGPGGLLVPPGDVRALANALREIVEDSSLRERLAQAGLAHAQHFSWELVAEQTLSAYRLVARL